MEAGHHGPHDHHEHVKAGAVAVGTKVTFHDATGPLSAEVVEYEEGRDEGDYYLLVKATSKSQDGQEWGNGPVFNTWSVVGGEQGAFEPVAR